MGAPVSIVLQRSERKKYEQLCRSGKTPVRLKERLTIVLLADDGLNNGEIAGTLRTLYSLNSGYCFTIEV